MASSPPDCSALKKLSDFKDYIDALKEETDFEISNLQACKVEICTAVYGTGNPDISGIGVTTGYIFEIALGLFLAVAFIIFKSLSGHHVEKARQIFACGLAVFYESAAYFTIAIQLATIAVLVEKDFGISTSDFGALETQITQVVSIICMLPLLPPVALLEGVDGEERHNARLLLLTLTVALSFYPFLSRCIHAFEKPPIGNGGDAKVSTEDWSKVEKVCFGDELNGLRNSGTYKATKGLQLATSLLIYLFALWLLSGIMNQHYPPPGTSQKQGWLQRLVYRRRRVSERFGGFGGIPLVAMLGLAVPLLWVIFQFRDVQKALAQNLQQSYLGNTWGFGQIVSVVIFVPVAVEMGYRWRFGGGNEPEPSSTKSNS
ncbi:Fc.00g028390.m01.CDS01 [Cosmosporella sp. VM-42]